MTTTYIYSLHDPETGRSRYVGKAGDPFDRLHGRNGHLYSARVGENTHKAKWICSLLRRGQEPVLEILDEVPESEWQFWEREWIRLYRALGFSLTNGTDGGDGVSLGSVPWNKGKKMSSEHVEKNRMAHLGVGAGKQLSDAHKRILSVRAVGNHRTLNLKKPGNTSGFAGVSWDAARGKWTARVSTRFLGRFSKKEDAVFVRALAVATRNF